MKTDQFCKLLGKGLIFTGLILFTAVSYCQKPKILVGEGEYQVFFIDQNGHLFGSGGNLRNLGVNNIGTAGLTMPVAVSPSNLTFKALAGSLHGGAAVDTNGNVWTMGDNTQGELGNGNTNAFYGAYKITTDNSGNPFTNINAVCAYFSGNTSNGFYAIKSDGSLWVWGQTLQGMKGNGTLGDSFTLRPVQVIIPGNRKVTQIVAGNIAIALCSDGTVWTWGGAGILPVNLGYGATGTNYLSPHQVTALSNITQIAGGISFNYALKSDGTLYGWGAFGSYMGNYIAKGGGTPIPTPVVLTNIMKALPSPIKTIVVNSVCTNAILTDGTLWGWGDNAQGTIGIGTELNYFTTTAPFAWDYGVGELLQVNPVRITNKSDFVGVFGSSVFTFYTYAEEADGTLWSWGRNKGTILGNGIIACTPDVTASYPNSWDVTTATIVNPFTLKSTITVASPYCVANPNGSPCNECSLAQNLSPVVVTSPAQTITYPTNTATIDGSKSYDPDGTIAAYTWSLNSGPSTPGIINTHAATTTVKNLIPGTYIFQLIVNDNVGTTGIGFDTIVVNAAANQPPVANAGANQTITLPVDSVTLNGSSSVAPAGSITAYSWSKVSGPAQGSIVNPAGVSTVVSNLAQGTYIFKLTVTDNHGNTGSDSVTVIVKAAVNQPPLANAGASQTIKLPTDSVKLDGTKSSDPDGTITTYNWTQVSGPSTATIVNGNTATPTAKGLIIGQYVFQLTVTDNGGATGNAQVKITVTAANQPPVANAGANQTITLPKDSVTLDGSSSTAPSGSITAYNWVQVSGPSSAVITSSASAITLAKNLIKGTYIFKLTVTDNNGATASDSATITVNAAPNQPPVANAGSSQTITLPVNSVNLNGTASTDPDGTITAYSWVEVSGPTTATITNANTAAPTANGLQAGQYIFQLTVTDNAGATGNAQVKITVVAANQPPVANAGPNQTITLPVNSVTLNGGSSVDPSGTITSYSWTRISGPASGTIATPNGVTTVVNGLVQGVYIFKLTITDNNAASASDSVTITVNPAVNQPPIANAGSSQTIILPTSSANLNGSASYDPDGTIASYSWTEVSGPSTASITNVNTATPSVNGLQAGLYTFQLTVTDNSGATGNAQVKITVSAAILPPVANAGANQTITLPVNSVTLDGSSSIAPSGSITGYSWNQVSGPASGNIANPASVTTTVTGLVQGTYIFKLIVTDNHGTTGSDSVIITVNPAVNKPPVANAGPSQSINMPVNSATLDGSKSYDPDGTIASYSWSEVSGPSTATITNGNTASPAVSGLQAGQYVFQLTVTDNSGATATAQVKITETATLNQSPVANAGLNQTITQPTNSITLDGSNSFDPDGYIVAYNWNKASGPGAVTITNANTVTPTVYGLQAGQYVFQLTVTDNSGATGSDQVTITVNSSGQPTQQLPPVANAGADTTISLPTDTTILNGTASTGNISSYQWQQMSGPNTALINSSASSVSMATNLIAGEYVFQLTVVDNQGNTSTASVKVTVVNALRYNKEQVILYPNPAHDIVNLRFISDSLGKVRVDIFDMTGRLVLSSEMDKSQSLMDNLLNISAFAPGIYAVQARIGDRVIITTKLVKQ